MACLEEIAMDNKWIDKEQVKALAQPMIKNEYGQYLMRIAQMAK